MVTPLFGRNTHLAALANEFLAFGALGSDTNDFAAKRSLLDAVEVFFKFLTIESLAASSYQQIKQFTTHGEFTF